MASGRVLVVGSLNADLVVRTARLPGPGETVTGSDLVIVPGGKSSNQAAAVGILDHVVVGDDDARGIDDEARTERLHLARIAALVAAALVAAAIVAIVRSEVVVTKVYVFEYVAVFNFCDNMHSSCSCK